jgi:hypothetical protein
MTIAPEPRRNRRMRPDPFADLDLQDVEVLQPLPPKPEPPKRPPVRLPEREADYRMALQNTTREVLSPDGLLAGLVIGHRYWQSGELYASQKTLAGHMNIPETSLKRVRNAVRELEQAGFLTSIGKTTNGTLHYRLTVPVLT